MTTPPGPIWSDELTGASVYVSGGVVEINMPDGWSGRLLPAEATKLIDGLAKAIAEANQWAERWNTETRRYEAS